MILTVLFEFEVRKNNRMKAIWCVARTIKCRRVRWTVWAFVWRPRFVEKLLLLILLMIFLFIVNIILLLIVVIIIDVAIVNVAFVLVVVVVVWNFANLRCVSESASRRFRHLKCHVNCLFCKKKNNLIRRLGCYSDCRFLSHLFVILSQYSGNGNRLVAEINGEKHFNCWEFKRVFCFHF